MRVLLCGPFDTNSGWGNDLVGMARGLGALGHDVHLAPLSVVPPIPADIAQLLCKPKQPPLDLTVVHCEPYRMDVPGGTRIVSQKVVGWTMWEWDEYREDLVPDALSTSLSRRLGNFDALLSYDHVTTAALDLHVPEGVEHRQLQGGYTSDDWEPVRRDWWGTLRFGMLGRLHDRKNPFAAIRAFSELKEEHGEDFDAELHLKTQVLGLHPQIEERYPGVRIYLANWPQKQVAEFYASLHCLLCPSRGEGKNVPALEAQSTGCPVIATNYGGHRDWLSEEWAYPLSYEMQTHEQGCWAEPDVAHLKQLMWRVYTDRDEARRKGELAARTIPGMCDWTKVLRRMEDMLRDIPGRTPISLP